MQEVIEISDDEDEIITGQQEIQFVKVVVTVADDSRTCNGDSHKDALPRNGKNTVMSNPPLGSVSSLIPQTPQAIKGDSDLKKSPAPDVHVQVKQQSINSRKRKALDNFSSAANIIKLSDQTVRAKCSNESTTVMEKPRQLAPVFVYKKTNKSLQRKVDQFLIPTPSEKRAASTEKGNTPPHEPEFESPTHHEAVGTRSADAIKGDSPKPAHQRCKHLHSSSRASNDIAGGDPARMKAEHAASGTEAQSIGTSHSTEDPRREKETRAAVIAPTEQAPTVTATQDNVARRTSIESNSPARDDSVIDPETRRSYEEVLAKDQPAVEGPYTYEEFKKLLDEAQEAMGVSTKEIEDNKMVKGANTKVNKEDSNSQGRAQYGRLTLKGSRELFRVLDLQPNDTFIDIGHGIGLVPLQAAYTQGCMSRGVELVSDRHTIATEYQKRFGGLESLSQEKKNIKHEVGAVELVHGRLEDPKNRDFITKSTKAFVNNAEDVFKDRSNLGKKMTRNLDDYIAGLFCLMKPGSVMVTFSRIPLGPSLSDVNSRREKHELEKSRYGSFYEVQENFNLGNDAVTWTGKPQLAFKYTRLEQNSERAFFLCSNPQCDAAKNQDQIPATTEDGDGKIAANSSCTCCNISIRGTRSRRGKLKVRYCEEDYLSP